MALLRISSPSLGNILISSKNFYKLTRNMLSLTLFLSSSKVTGNKPQKMKLKPSPATMPVTPQVEIPPKPSSSAIPDPKDAINLDDLPSATVNSVKRASPFKHVPEEPEATSAEAMANDAPKKLTLSGAHGTPATHPHLFSVLRRAPLHQRHMEMTNLMNEVWGEPDPEQKELAILEDNLHVLFVKHKAVRQVTLAPKHWVTEFLPSKKF
jgi:hypothetical protein